MHIAEPKIQYVIFLRPRPIEEHESAATHSRAIANYVLAVNGQEGQFIPVHSDAHLFLNWADTPALKDFVVPNVEQIGRSINKDDPTVVLDRGHRSPRSARGEAGSGLCA
jgi:hypothetical protein